MQILLTIQVLMCISTRKIGQSSFKQVCSKTLQLRHLKDRVKMKGYSVLNIKKLVLKHFIGAHMCTGVLSMEISVQK